MAQRLFELLPALHDRRKLRRTTVAFDPMEHHSYVVKQRIFVLVCAKLSCVIEGIAGSGESVHRL